MVKNSFLALLLSLFAASSSLAEPIQLLSEKAPVDFVIEDVICLLSYRSGKMGLLKGQAVPLNQGKVLVGARVEVPDGEALHSYSFLLRGKGGQTHTIPIRRLNDKARGGGEIEGLRLAVATKQLQLRDLEEKRLVSEEILRKLRSDVDQVSDIGRIVQVKEELIRKQAELESARKNIELFKKFFSSVQSGTSPKGLAQREAELSRQLPELAVLAKKAETVANKQKAADPAARKHSLAELGRTTDIERLEKQLLTLREKRKSLEEPKASFYSFW